MPISHQSAAHTLADPRWAAIVARDANAAFFYGVQSTGVYCRPCCAARRPRPENVHFFAHAEDAERAGFRPCQRCRPDQPASTPHAALIERLCRQIEAAETVPALHDLARDSGLSASRLQRVFKSVTGLTPRAYAAAYRARKLRQTLVSAPRVTDAMYDTGFGSSGRFYAQTDTLLGMTPGRFRARGAGVTIRFAVGQCSLGAVLVAASDIGICAISLGDDANVLLRELQDHFTQAELIGGDAEFERWVAQVVGFVDDPKIGLDLPLDVRGTAFQHRVWQALCDIPPGSTLSYTELARRIGAPRSVRAVAAACAANSLAVAIPCHRVVRRDGDLAGYRWGIERKRALIEKEKA